MQVEIYLIMNRFNFKKYVGLTSRTVEKRFYEHSINRTSAIGLAIQKYGRDNFLIVILEICDTLEQANEREKFWIAFHDCIAPNGYNLEEGGHNAIPTAETRKKLSESHKGIHPSAETLAKMSKSRKERRKPEKNVNRWKG